MIPLPNRKVYIDVINKLLQRHLAFFVVETKSSLLGGEIASIHTKMLILHNNPGRRLLPVS